MCRKNEFWHKLRQTVTSSENLTANGYKLVSHFSHEVQVGISLSTGEEFKTQLGAERANYLAVLTRLH